MRKQITVTAVSAIAHVRREELSADELERLAGTEELEIAANSGTAALMSQTELEKRGKIYSVKKLHEMLYDEDDDTNETVREGLEQLLHHVEEYHYFWLI